MNNRKKSLKSSAEPKAAEKQNAGSKDFLVVGIGASAGGVEALQNFLSTMSPDSGMAFVVVLHPASAFESKLRDIIQSQTTMPVTLIEGPQVVEPDRVYVIPPDRHVEMVDGTVRPLKIGGERGSRATIDGFFRTLAHAARENAVGVILSGTGTDGASGLKAIKEANGFAVVQSPADAAYDGMPRSAIATGVVDWILPVREMPEKLLRYRRRGERMQLPRDADDQRAAPELPGVDALHGILSLLRRRTGHDFSVYKTPTLMRRIARQLQIHDLPDLASYHARLREKPEEIQTLLKNLLINVTNFFRDPEAWAALERDVLPALFAGKKGGDTIRVWSSGCATGEEAYSLAMILNEFCASLPDPPNIQVFATDVAREALDAARAGRYPLAIEADVAPALLERFFFREGEFYRVRNELHEKILFAPHNVLRDPPFSRLDLIACRNLLIYLNRETQERVLEIFHFALASQGFLFLGSSETAEAVPQIFAPVDKKQRIYRRRPASASRKFAPPPVVADHGELILPEIKPDTKPAPPTSLGDVHFRLLEQYAPPSVLVSHDHDIRYLTESAAHYLRFRGGAPSNNLLKLIHPDLLPDLRAALFTARREQRAVEYPNVRAEIDGTPLFVDLFVRPVDVEYGEKDLLLVIFNTHRRGAPATGDAAQTPPRRERRDEALETDVRRLAQELARTKRNLRATIEQHEVSIEELKSSNEQLQAINEDLRATTEDLETSREELQSVNEELSTLNHELKEKMEEATRTNSDLQNLMASTDIATIFLDRSFRIKRYTPPVEKLFNITRADRGRLLEHFTHRLVYADLAEDAATVLCTQTPLEREILDLDDRVYLTRFAPYRTIDDRIEGVVLNFVDITDRHRAERILRESEERLASIFRGAAVGLSEIAPDGRFLFVNEHLCEILGRTRDELLQLKFQDVTYAEDIDPSLWAFRRLLETGAPVSIDKRYLRKNGTLVWANSALSMLRAAAAPPVVLAVTVDLTARRQADAAVRQSEERMRIAIEAAELATWEWNLVEECIVWNERHFSILGLRATGKLVKPDTFFRRVHPHDRARLTSELQTAIESNKPFDSEFCIVLPDGKTRWMRGYGQVTERDRAGKALKMSGVMIDVTDRRDAEEALRKSEEQLNLILESTKDYAIITFDLKGCITRWNAGAEKIFGWTEKEVLGKTTHLIFTPEDVAAKEPEKELEGTLRNGRAEDERWHLRKDGSRFFASGVMQLLRDGQIEGFVKICRDQTARLEAEQSALEKLMLRRMVSAQEDERRRIARDIHDHFGQQITALRLKLEAIQKAAGANAEVIRHTEDAQQAAAALDANVDFIAWELRPVSLDDLGLSAALANFVGEWSNHTGIRADFHSSGMSRTRLDPEIETNLYRIAQEALNNIQKHAAPDNVSVLLEKSRHKVTLIIEDDGIGFNPKDKKNRRKGLGLLGMSERARICGGEIEIESAKGKGTTVFARIPLKKG